MTVVEVVLGSGSGRRLILRADSAERAPHCGYDATLTVPGGSVTRHVDDDASLARYVAQLAVRWQGFDGSRDYQSAESELRLSCRHDGFGTLTCQVALGQPWDPAWWLSAEVELEAGQLDRLAAEVAALVGDRGDG